MDNSRYFATKTDSTSFSFSYVSAGTVAVSDAVHTGSSDFAFCCGISGTEAPRRTGFVADLGGDLIMAFVVLDVRLMPCVRRCNLVIVGHEGVFSIDSFGPPLPKGTVTWRLRGTDVLMVPYISAVAVSLRSGLVTFLSPVYSLFTGLTPVSSKHKGNSKGY